MDSFAALLADARKRQFEAALAVLDIEAGAAIPPPLTRDEALARLRAVVVDCQALIEHIDGLDCWVKTPAPSPD